MLVSGVRYIQKSIVDQVFREIGYRECCYDERPQGQLQYENSNPGSKLPSPLTLSYPDVAVDGTLWWPRDAVFDLMDRLSDAAPEDEVIIRAIRQLDC